MPSTPVWIFSWNSPIHLAICIAAKLLTASCFVTFFTYLFQILADVSCLFIAQCQSQNLNERELMLLLVWNNSSAWSNNTQTLVTFGSEKTQKVLQKHQHVTSKHNTDQSKTQNTMDSFLFSKQNPTST